MLLRGSTKASKKTRRASSPPFASRVLRTHTEMARQALGSVPGTPDTWRFAWQSAWPKHGAPRANSRRCFVEVQAQLVRTPFSGRFVGARFRIAFTPTGKWTFIGGPSRRCGVPSSLQICQSFSSVWPKAKEAFAGDGLHADALHKSPAESPRAYQPSRLLEGRGYFCRSRSRLEVEPPTA